MQQKQRGRLKRGTEITAIFGGEQVRRTVWVDLETLILACTDEEYQKALAEQRDPRLIGIRGENVLQVH